jgi:hypothetical protein
VCLAGLDRIRSHRDNLEVLGIISEEDYKSRCKAHDVAWTFFENQPLGAKKNHGLKVALSKDWDYLMELNSDDLIKNELLDLYDTMSDDYLGVRNFCYLNSVTNELRQSESKTVYGIARRYSRKAVEACKVTEVICRKSCISAAGALNENVKYDIKHYIAKDLERVGYVEILGRGVKMWKDDASAGMDNFSNKRLNENGFKCRQIFTDEPLAVDIKSDTNIWKFNPEAGVKYDLREFLIGLPELYGFINSNCTDINTGNTVRSES